MENMEMQKNCAKKKSGNLDKKSFDKNGPYLYMAALKLNADLMQVE